MTIEQFDAQHTFLDNTIMGLMAQTPNGAMLQHRDALLVFEWEESVRRCISERQLTGEWEFLPVRYGEILKDLHDGGCRYFLDHGAYDRFLQAEDKDLRLVLAVDRAETADGVRLKPVYDPFSDAIDVFIPQLNRAVVGFCLEDDEHRGGATPDHYLIFGQISAFQRHYGRAACSDPPMAITWEAYRAKMQAGVALSTDEVAWKRVVGLRRQQSFYENARD